MGTEPTLNGRPLVTVRLPDLGVDAFHRCYRELLEPAFPSAELMTLDDLERARHSPDTGGLVLVDDGLAVAAMITEEYLGGRIRLLAYLVVTDRARGCGIGAQLLSTLSGQSNPPVVLAEIEDPRFHSRTETNDPVSRLRFYDREGCRLLPLSYVQPSLRPGSPRVENLLLIAVSAPGQDIEGGLIADFLEEYYCVCEGADVVSEDPMFLSLRHAAGGDAAGRLPLFSLQRLQAARPDPPAMQGDAG